MNVYRTCSLMILKLDKSFGFYIKFRGFEVEALEQKVKEDGVVIDEKY